ncbi:MAG: large conductance mechanosensitive channel protein MscL [Clostridia bacterium]|nr:large conductance mechanosensitive channel protein MscL [Clostridia bacterium]
MRNFFNEFKKFITRGNVLDMAVGVIVGGAFTAIVNALSNNILKPIIDWILALIIGANSLDSVYTFLKKAYVDGTAVIDLEKSIYIDWGAFINAIINFLLIALVLFCIVKAINTANEKVAQSKGKYAPLTKEEIIALRKEGKSRKEILTLAKEKADKLAEEQRLAEEEAQKNAPKTEAQLLEEVVALLKEQQK